MTKYTNYGFYTETYKGNMPEDKFDTLVIRASTEVCNAICNRDITGHENDVQMATCSVADVLYSIEQLENKKNTSIANKALKSESVGDYSRTYETYSAKEVEEQISNQNQKINEEIKKYLLWTGLLYRGVVYVR